MEALLVKCADDTKTGGEGSNNGHRSVIKQTDLNHIVKLTHLTNLRLNIAKHKVTQHTNNKCRL